MITEIIRPNAVGDYSECFQYPSAGAHWDKVDDVSPDDDATYVQAPAIAYQPPRREAYHLPSLSGLPSLISSVVVYARVRRVAQNPAGGYHAYACVGVRIAGRDYYTGHNIYGNSYTTISKTFSTNPNTGQPWTKDDIDNLQSYIALDWYNRALYQGGYIAARCTQVYVEITYLAPPSVITMRPTNIGAISATLNGMLDSDGGEPCDCGFEWGLTAGYGNETPWQSDKHIGDAFVQPIAGLEADTVYHFRARARNSAGLASGADMTFRTSRETIEVSRSLVDPSLKLLLEEET